MTSAIGKAVPITTSSLPLGPSRQREILTPPTASTPPAFPPYSASSQLESAADGGGGGSSSWSVLALSL
ncbi:hypothetical protein HUJ04_006046 [Dendroctonus ponderosae]|nr:hypothetical protein HUJ04_006046 [Dendroctonus ponderosae]